MGGTMTVEGGRPLYGTVEVPAAKNSVLPLLAASILCSGPMRLEQVPRLSDVEDCLAILRAVGCTAAWEGQDVAVSGPAVWCRMPLAETERMRASVLFAAPLLARLGRVETALPGGCKIGARPVDWHLSALEQMGARVSRAGDRLVITAPAGLRGAELCLPGPSVGATETVLMAGCAARGQTILHGAAKEPEIVDLAAFLNRCGGRIDGAGTDEIRIEGPCALHGASWRPVPDRICASTLACAVASARGWVTIAGCSPALYAPVLDVLEGAGCTVVRGTSSATVGRMGTLRGAGHLVTGGYPGLATDAAPLVAAALLSAEGETWIQARVFEARFACAEGFRAMGAGAAVQGRTLWLAGGKPLHGAAVSAPDLRGGAALVVAALGAGGKTRIEGCEYIARGYADLGEMLAGLGARIV